jgi:hypothetical protein
MNISNWPGGVNRTSSNWTGRTPRVSEWGGNWAPNSYAIPWGRAAMYVIGTGAAFLVFTLIGALVF